jgi:hypothetical protein
MKVENNSNFLSIDKELKKLNEVTEMKNDTEHVRALEIAITKNMWLV